MTADDVVQLYHELESIGVIVWIDGGWGVDVLLREQTRPHDDLDIAINEIHVPALRNFLESRGYRELPERTESRWNYVLGDAQGREVDVHSFVTDSVGQIIEGIKYPSGSLTGTGTIAGQSVRCIDAEHLVKFHSGYELRETDRMDVRKLCERFGIELPDEHR